MDQDFSSRLSHPQTGLVIVPGSKAFKSKSERDWLLEFTDEGQGSLRQVSNAISQNNGTFGRKVAFAEPSKLSLADGIHLDVENTPKSNESCLFRVRCIKF